MKLSVIVPMYNSEAYIGECLASLVSQSLDDMEIICVDNCSTDGTVKKAREYEDNFDQIRVFVNESNNGQAYSVNRGLDLANGEFVAECDADDWVHPDMYRILYQNIKGGDVAQCGWYDIYGSHATVRQSVANTITVNPMTDFSPKNRANFIIGQPHIMSAIYRKSFLLENGIRYREGYQFEDTALAFKIRTTAKKYTMIPMSLYYYRKGVPGSGTMTIDCMDGVFQQYEEMYRWNREHNLGLDKELGVAKYYTYLWGASRAKTDSDREAFWKRASAEFKNDVIEESFFFNQDDLDNYNFIKDM